ncbi:MAG TPA: DNA methyltransferase [Candidatus Limnocylindrales bacterium]|nr:DNA methyltransferase [Candidatus Limnocylindrales bacterium]
MPEPSAASAHALEFDLPGSTRRSASSSTAPSAQLELGLPAPIPGIAIAPEWKDQQRLWGHAFHPMCSYLASFPAALAHAFIARYSRPGDVVLDPFSGRGTTPLQACAEGRFGVGNDLNPFAHLLTAAKVEPAARSEARTRLTALRLAWAAEAEDWTRLGGTVVEEALGMADAPRPGSGVAGACHVPAAGSGHGPDSGDEAVPAEVALAFHPRTLGQMLAVRSALRLDDRVDRFLAAALTGILHGKSASYVSEVMPNTFSMAPRYVRDFVTRTAFRSPDRDVFDGLGLKLGRLYRHGLPSAGGIALLGDARDVGTRTRAALRARSLPDRARLVVSSPPYLRVVKYGYYNWLRAWACGFDPNEIDATLDDAHHRKPYVAFLREVLAALRPALTDDAVVVLVIGDVETDRGRPIRDGIGLAETVWEEAAAPEGYRLAGVALDDVHAGRKMTKLWGSEAGNATKLDRILVLGATEAGRRRAISSASLPVDWAWPPRGLRAI